MQPASCSADSCDGREPIALTWQRTFGQMPVGAPLLYQDSLGTISLSDNQASIAARLGLAVDQPVRIRAA